MNRHYTAEEYRKIVDDLRQAFTNCSITTDVMVGFAGETEEEFKRSADFVKSIAFAKVHVFPYSRREGTRAYNAPNQIDGSVKTARAKIMTDLTNKSRQDFLNSQIGLTEDVLFEQPIGGGYWEGYTKNYTPVKVLCDKNINGEILKVKLISVDKEHCVGNFES